MMLFFCLGLARSLEVLDSFEYTIEEEWTYFFLDSELVNGNLRVSMLMSTVTECVLTLDFGKYPVFDKYKNEVEAEYSDYDAWKLSRSNHVIVVPESEISNSIIIGIGKPNLYPTSFTVTMKYETSLDPLCPNDCSGNGTCEETSCSCDDDYIGYDCSTSASQLDDGRWYSYYLSRDYTAYCYFPLDSSLIGLSVTAKWEGERAMIAFDYDGHDEISVPTDRDFYTYIYLSSDTDEKKIIFNVDALKGDSLNIALLNTLGYDDEIMILMKLEAEYSLIEFTLIVYIFIIISAFFLSLIIFVAVVRCRRDNRAVIPNTQTNGIPIEIIDKKFPKILYENQDMTNCIICLDNFKPKDIIRKLTCSHIFHANCIEEWLTEHKICCLCKTNCLEHDTTVDATRNLTNIDRNNALVVSNID